MIPHRQPPLTQIIFNRDPLNSQYISARITHSLLSGLQDPLSQESSTFQPVLHSQAEEAGRKNDEYTNTNNSTMPDVTPDPPRNTPTTDIFWQVIQSSFVTIWE